MDTDEQLSQTELDRRDYHRAYWEMVRADEELPPTAMDKYD